MAAFGWSAIEILPIKMARAGPSHTGGPVFCFRRSDASGTDRIDAGWSSPVARQAHNLKVTGSNPVPAPTISEPLVPETEPGVFF